MLIPNEILPASILDARSHARIRCSSANMLMPIIQQRRTRPNIKENSNVYKRQRALTHTEVWKLHINTALLGIQMNATGVFANSDTIIDHLFVPILRIRPTLGSKKQMFPAARIIWRVVTHLLLSEISMAYGYHSVLFLATEWVQPVKGAQKSIPVTEKRSAA